jgi:hypothetical protein
LRTSGEVVTTKIFDLDSSDLHALVVKAELPPADWKYYSVRVATNADGDILKITIKKTEKLGA